MHGSHAKAGDKESLVPRQGTSTPCSQESLVPWQGTLGPLVPSLPSPSFNKPDLPASTCFMGQTGPNPCSLSPVSCITTPSRQRARFRVPARGSDGEGGQKAFLRLALSEAPSQGPAASSGYETPVQTLALTVPVTAGPAENGHDTSTRRDPARLTRIAIITRGRGPGFDSCGAGACAAAATRNGDTASGSRHAGGTLASESLPRRRSCSLACSESKTGPCPEDLMSESGL